MQVQSFTSKGRTKERAESGQGDRPAGKQGYRSMAISGLNDLFMYAKV